MRSLCRGAGEGERGVHGWRFGDFAALVPFGERDFRLRIAKFSWRELRDAGLTRRGVKIFFLLAKEEYLSHTRRKNF